MCYDPEEKCEGFPGEVGRLPWSGKELGMVQEM
jgi:hypothetical protein